MNLCLIFCKVLYREFCHFVAHSRNIVDMRPLPQGLHNTPDILREKVQAEIDIVDKEDYDAILIGYGLCSNGTIGLSSSKHRLVIPRAHDCITLFLGSKERYRKYFDSHPGTYWYTPGWIEQSTQPGAERFEAIYNAYVEKFGEDNARYLMEVEQGWMKEYSRSTYVDLGMPKTDKYRKYTKRCAEYLEWEYDEQPGDPSLVRDFIEGEWDEERFLVLEPGQQVAAKYDEMVLNAK